MLFAISLEPLCIVAILFWLVFHYLRHQRWFWAWYHESLPNWIHIVHRYIVSPLVRTGFWSALSVYAAKWLIGHRWSFALHTKAPWLELEAKFVAVMAIGISFCLFYFFSYHLYRELSRTYRGFRRVYMIWYERAMAQYVLDRARLEEERRDELLEMDQRAPGKVVDFRYG